MNTTNFIFFSNGKTLSSIKNEAKRLHKSGQFNSRSSALNYISKSICGLSFNKAVKEFEHYSPIQVNNKIFLPLFHNNCKFFVIAGEDTVSITNNYTLKYPYDLKFKNPKFKNFNKTDNGWIVILEDKEKQMVYLDIKTTDEGIVIDIICEETLDKKHYETFNVSSTYAFWDEIYNNYEINFLKFDSNNKLSDMEAAIQLNHASEGDRTEIAKYKNMVLSLNGAIQILYNDSYYYGSNVNQLINILINDEICTKEDFLQWLVYNDYSDKNPLNKTDIECIHNPWFDICYENGEPVSECFDSISKDIFLHFIEEELK